MLNPNGSKLPWETRDFVTVFAQKHALLGPVSLQLSGFLLV